MKKEIIEEWRNIIGFEGKYQVSNLGRIKSLRNNKNNPREKIMKPQLTKDGYYRIGLRKNGKQKRYLVHRLVALAFIPNPDNLPMINHKDENKTNNCVDNLEWCDCKYNVNYGTGIDRRSKKILNCKELSKQVLQFDLEGNLVNEFPSTMEAERQTGFHNANISRCCLGKAKTHKGFIWRYKEE